MVQWKKGYQRKQKQCVECGCDCYVWSKGRCKNCAGKEYAATVKRNRSTKWTSEDYKKLQEEGKVETISPKQKKLAKNSADDFAKILAASKRSKKTLSKFLEDRLDHWFSIYTRIKDANENGQVQCVITKRWFHWRDLDCGHFITRNHFATRWEKDNAWPQSQQSNRFAGGQQFEMGLYIDQVTYKGRGEELVRQSNEKGPDSFRRIEMLIELKEETKRIAKEKGLKLN